VTLCKATNQYILAHISKLY